LFYFSVAAAGGGGGEECGAVVLEGGDEVAFGGAVEVVLVEALPLNPLKSSLHLLVQLHNSRFRDYLKRHRFFLLNNRKRQRHLKFDSHLISRFQTQIKVFSIGVK
jgi:hypothetical protein